MPDNSRLAKIHIAKKDLKLTEEPYRDILWLNFQVESSSDLNNRQADELIELFKAKGWKQKTSAKPKQHKRDGNYIEIKPGPAAAQQRKVLALWNALGYGIAKIHARVKTQFGVDRFEWLVESKALHILITDLEHRLDKRAEKK